jgi:2-polyprenyl-3-methyl-5-hydroxy-6-metoxy-1,4-benzoquinol methylase
MKSLNESGYNERLFSAGFRRYIHLARFVWLEHEIRRLGCAHESVVELGCFDGKLIDFLPSKPKRYVGFDANWEGGLDLAVQKWKQFPQYSFVKACVPEDMSLTESDRFDIAVIMETLEHVPPGLVDGYLRRIKEHTKGYIFITVPNEKGLVFLTKWLVKKLLSKDAERYSISEFLNATLGRMHKVKRREHKGFDYSSLVREVEKHFKVVSVSGHPMGFLPTFLCFGVGIVGRAKE